jgi:flavodoxin
MKSLIVCVSTSHGNTRRVADRMAEVLDAEVVEPESVDLETVGEYDLVGFGSGIYFMAVHARLRKLLRRLPDVDGVQAFSFFTSGASEIPLAGYSKPIRKQLTAKGFHVIGSFCCRGFDTVGPFDFIGGINKGRPDDHDLDRAAAFAARLRKQVAGSQAAS